MYTCLSCQCRRITHYISVKAHSLITFLKQKGDPSVY